MNPIERLAEMFERFPGIGPRQARRFVQYLLAASTATRSALAEEVRALGGATGRCKKCFRWFVPRKYQGESLIKNSKDSPCCEICTDHHRDSGLLFVVEKDADVEPVEQSSFRGLYFVLGGTVPLASEEPEKHIRAKELLKRVEEDAGKGALKEIILGLSATAEGDHTRLYLQEKLRPVAEGFKIKLSALGRGLSTGSELEYADPDTIAQALGNRR